MLKIISPATKLPLDVAEVCISSSWRGVTGGDERVLHILVLLRSPKQLQIWGPQPSAVLGVAPVAELPPGRHTRAARVRGAGRCAETGEKTNPQLYLHLQHLSAPLKISLGHHQRPLPSACTLVVTAQMPHEGPPWRDKMLHRPKCSSAFGRRIICAGKDRRDHQVQPLNLMLKSEFPRPQGSVKDTRQADCFR